MQPFMRSVVLPTFMLERTDASFYLPTGRYYSEVRGNMMENLWEGLDWGALQAVID